MSDLHLGVILPMAGTPDIRAAARRAEECGLDGAWAGDHLVSSAPVLDSAMALTAAAAVTERITVGWSVLLIALRQQAWAAKQIASLQHLSAGRVQLGIGVGGVESPNEWTAAGVSSRSRGARTDAMLAGLPSLLAGRPTVLSAEPQAPTVMLQPAVPMPPLWIGGGSDAALKRVVTHDAGWLAALEPPDVLAARVHNLALLAHRCGRPRPRVGTMVFAAPTPQRDSSAVERAADALRSWYGLSPKLARAVAVGGGPEQLAEALNAYRVAGADTIVVVPFGDDILVSYDVLGRARTLLAQAA